MKKRWNHRIRFVPALLPLRSGSVPASSPWSLNATMIISMSRCQGLLPRKNHQKTRVVYQGQFTHQKIHQVVATKKSPWNPRSVNATMIIPIYITNQWKWMGISTNLMELMEMGFELDTNNWIYIYNITNFNRLSSFKTPSLSMIVGVPDTTQCIGDDHSPLWDSPSANR